jgi:hypothetical protein
MARSHEYPIEITMMHGDPITLWWGGRQKVVSLLEEAARAFGHRPNTGKGTCFLYLGDVLLHDFGLLCNYITQESVLTLVARDLDPRATEIMRQYRCQRYIPDNDRKYLELNGVHLPEDPAQLLRVRATIEMDRMAREGMARLPEHFPEDFP